MPTAMCHVGRRTSAWQPLSYTGKGPGAGPAPFPVYPLNDWTVALRRLPPPRRWRTPTTSSGFTQLAPRLRKAGMGDLSVLRRGRRERRALPVIPLEGEEGAAGESEPIVILTGKQGHFVCRDSLPMLNSAARLAAMRRGNSSISARVYARKSVASNARWGLMVAK
jgi:hypothetical protein